MLDQFLFNKLNVPDPRKDRGQGASYLKCMNFSELFDQKSMKEVLQVVLSSSAAQLSESGSAMPKIICDKTPENLVSIDVIDQVVPADGFRFLHLLRDPVSIFGARRQRLDYGVDDFVKFFRHYSEPIDDLGNCSAFAIVRYENMINNPVSAIQNVVRDLGISHLIDDASVDRLSQNINPGKYLTYVGQKIDPKRDLDNRAMVSKEEQELIYQELAGYCERYSYGPYAEDQ